MLVCLSVWYHSTILASWRGGDCRGQEERLGSGAGGCKCQEKKSTRGVEAAGQKHSAPWLQPFVNSRVLVELFLGCFCLISCDQYAIILPKTPVSLQNSTSLGITLHIPLTCMTFNLCH